MRKARMVRRFRKPRPIPPAGWSPERVIVTEEILLEVPGREREPTGRQGVVRRSSSLTPTRKTQTRPGVIDRADLEVHESLAESKRAHFLLAERGAHSRGLLRPRDPECPTFLEQACRR